MLLASSIFDEGENLPSVSVLILAGGETGSKKGRRLRQRIGRVLRLAEGKERALVIDFFDKTHQYLEKHSKKRLEVYRVNKIEHSIYEFS